MDRSLIWMLVPFENECYGLYSTRPLNRLRLCKITSLKKVVIYSSCRSPRMGWAPWGAVAP